MASSRTIVAHHFDSLEQQRAAQTAGMWIFLATEMLVFGALFVGYTAYRSYYAEGFAAASRHLNALIGGANTLVLLTSSLTMALAVYATRTGQRKLMLACLALTALLGAVFMILKAVEYYIDYRENLVPRLAFDPQEWLDLCVDPRQVQLFLAFYYVMTGLHALHMVAGIGVLCVVIALAWLGRFTRENHAPVEVMGLYWHFVDIVWIFLLPTLYLVGTRTSLV